jgi:hypothetical protein
VLEGAAPLGAAPSSNCAQCAGSFATPLWHCENRRLRIFLLSGRQPCRSPRDPQDSVGLASPSFFQDEDRLGIHHGEFSLPAPAWPANQALRGSNCWPGSALLSLALILAGLVTVCAPQALHNSETETPSPALAPGLTQTTTVASSTPRLMATAGAQGAEGSPCVDT